MPTGASDASMGSSSSHKKPYKGNYADPSSPIASTPLKRPRVASAKTTSTRKNAKQRPDDKRQTTLDGMFSPGKEPPKEKQLFSPALKKPVASKVTKARKNLDEELESAGASEIPAQSKVEVKASSSEEEDKIKECEDSWLEDGVEADVETLEEEEEETEPEFNPFLFIKTLPKYEDVVGDTPRAPVIPPKSEDAPNVCLVLDLDETLVHCSIEDTPDPDLKFPVTFNGSDYTVSVKKRPHLDEFLRTVSSLFEVVVFTASHRAYAEKLLDLLDAEGSYIHHRIYREGCLDVFGNFLKDLHVLGRPLEKVVLVDNSPHAFGYQVSNGIPIETWYDDDSDEELLKLVPFLSTLVDAKDVRPLVENEFELQKRIDATADEIS